jgi:alcohol dehydrogenase class IV
MFLCANKLYNGWEIYKRVLKLEFRPNYIPDIALVDPELTLTCPSPVTIACGLDAFIFESYFSTNASVLTDTLAFEGMIRINRSLISVCTDKDHDIDAAVMWLMGSIGHHFSQCRTGNGSRNRRCHGGAF